jgi:molybdenum-dependent DNA-binding transcriptional regulator ModE
MSDRRVWLPVDAVNRAFEEPAVVTRPSSRGRRHAAVVTRPGRRDGGRTGGGAVAGGGG